MQEILRNIKLITRNMPMWIISCLLLSLWIAVHTPAIHYGVNQLPYHEAFIGDEQSPIIGALHIFSERNLFAISDLETLYYGPLFAAISMPAVLVNYIMSSFESGSFSPIIYKSHILYDWGGILLVTRIMTLTFSFLGLLALYKILTTKTVNKSGSFWLPILGILLLATDYFYFSYSSFFRHWTYILVPALWQIFLLIRMYEKPSNTSRYLIWNGLLAVFPFGINYPAILTQVLLLPWFIEQFRRRGLSSIKEALGYLLIVVFGCLLMVLWHIRHAVVYLSIFTSDTLGIGQNEFSLTTPTERSASFPYYFDILINNYFAISIALAILLFILYKNRDRATGVFQILIPVFLFGLTYSLLLGFHPVYVSRYVLPTVLTLIVLVSIIFVAYYKFMPRLVQITLIILLVFQVIFHATTLLFWLNAMSEGPVIRQTVSEILKIQRDDLDKQVLVVPPRLLGWPHTKDSYEKYTELVGEQNRPLFKGYQDSIAPNTQLLDVKYATTVQKNSFDEYDELYVCNDLIREGFYETDYSEIKLVRVWTTNRYWEPNCARYTNRK